MNLAWLYQNIFIENDEKGKLRRVRVCKLHKNVSINMYDILLYREVCGIYAYKKSWIGRVKVVC